MVCSAVMTGYGAHNLQYLTIMAAILFGYHGNGGSKWKKFHTFFIPNDIPVLTG